ncbi:putative T7SS-secreted protein [Streptomyces sp. NPDC051211]|uniref:putative T7SS-secreted protein n=1 Tax=Streptomyces sp. NPDC051211 TaxID=3154643 RepID=UPI0034505F65
MGWGDFIPDSVEDWAEDRAEDVGDFVEWAGNKTAGIAEKAGLDDAGDWIRDKSRSAANTLGADVAELELGQTEDPKKLVYGSVSKIRSQASHLKDFQKSFTNVGNGLKALQGDGLKGKSADSFREAVAKEPPKWFKAADAFGKAADAVTRFAETVEWAQGQAKEALAEYQAARKASQDAVDAHNKNVDTYNDALKAKQDPLPPRPGTFTDPGKAKAAAAQDKLDSARRQRNDMAETARTAIRAARDAAPPKPSYGEQLKDGAQYFDIAKEHLAGGLIKGTAGLLNFARSINPTDPYNLTHPAEYLTNLNSTVSGLVTAVNDPLGTGKNMLDQFMKDPNEGIGKLLPELIGTKGLGAAKKAGTIAKTVDDLPGDGRTSLDKNGPDKSDKTDGNKTSQGTDPVDLATGRMYLPQTDIVLPGTLPLVFTRRAESGYTAGRWFGPSWSSTVDQHLEIDAEGIVFVAEDGLLLSYPHPAPGLPVLPVTGPRRPLARTPDGDYTLTDPDTGHTRRFTPEGRIESLTDRNGNSITFEHDEHGTPLALTHSGGYQLRLDTADGRIIALHLTGGPRILAYAYTDGNLTSVTNSSGLPLRLTYDDRCRITSWTDTNGSRYDYAYDERDRCIAEGGAAGHLALTIDYDGTDPATGHRITTVTTSAGHIRRYLIDRRYRVLAETDPLGATTRFTYDRHGRLLTRTDPLGHTTACSYDEEGRLISVVRPDGRTTRAEYDDLGLPVKVTATDGTVVRQTFDERGNRISLTTSDGATTRFAYDDRGHLASVTDPLGAVTRMVCDAAGLRLSVTNPLGAVSSCTRDAFGRPVTLTDALGRTTHLTWSAEGRLVGRVHPDGTGESWTYDGEGNCITHTDPVGGVTVSEYGDFDLPTARTTPDGTRHEFTHDTELRLTGITNPQGLAWTYTYDPAGRLIAETDFDARTRTYEYDAAGRLTARTNALGLTTTYEHNSLGQVTRKTAAEGITSFEYDTTDQLALARSPFATITWLRDRHGRLLSETVDGRRLTYTYDALGRRTGRTTPSGAHSAWTYDAAGHRAALTTSGRTLTFDRDAAGQELTRTFTDALTLTHTYDETGRLTTQHLTGQDGRTLQRRGYAYRADGALTELDDLLSGHRTFTLDAAARVTAVEAPTWSEQYAYDSAGNQTAAAWPTTHPGAESQGPRTYAGTRLTAAGSVRYEHDAQGRVTLRQKTRISRKPDTWRYAWDAEDRLSEVVTPDGTTWRYTYDPLGRRTAKQRLATDGSVVEAVHFTWDGTTLCEQITDGVTLTWTHDGLHPLTQTESNGVDERFFAIVTDLIGTPKELVAEDGTIAWHTRSTLWGTTTWNRDATAYTPLRFPGQYYDPETGLHHNYFRTYDPETARYLTPDPLGLAPAPNPATYVGNPHTWSDPLGLAPYPPRLKDGGWDLRGHDPLSIVPKHANMRILTPDPNGGAQKGVEYHWYDKQTGNVVRLRVHDADGTAPPGSNAANGDVYRISIGGRYQDEAGNLYHRNVHKDQSPHFDPEAANRTHIPWPSAYPLPY